MNTEQIYKFEPELLSIENKLPSLRHLSNSIQTSKYFDFMSPPIDHEQLMEEIKSKWQKLPVFITSQCVNNTNISIHQCSSNKEALTLLIHIKGFTILIYTLNVDRKSKHHQLECQFSGNFGKIYKVNAHNSLYAIKCYQFKDNFAQVIKNAINEYIIFTIAALLEAGPSMNCLYGFNIIIYSECIEFSMEFCDHSHNINNNLKGELTLALKKLHHLNIIHYDIKPQNICFSRTFNKYVFIDFGLSRVINENIGQSSLTYFRGSSCYCSPEMLKTYLTDTDLIVDLYYNDVHCLIQTFSEIDRRKMDTSSDCVSQKDKIQLELPNTQIVELASQLSRFKYEMYILSDQNCQKQVRDLFEQIANKGQKYWNQIFAFSQSLKFNPIIEQMKHLYLKDDLYQVRDNIIFSRITKLYKKDAGKEDQKQQKYQRRYQTLLHLNQTIDSLQYNALPHISDIFNKEKIKKMQTSVYLLSLIQFIDIYNDQQQYSKKISACKVMCSLFKQKEHIQDEYQYLQMAYQYLFQYSLEKPMTNNKIKILQKVILPLIIMEIKNQQQIIDCFTKILNLDTLLLDKLRLIHNFMTSVIWICQKYKTRYNYHTLDRQLTFLSLNYLKSLQTKTEKESLLLEMAMESISSPYQKYQQVELLQKINSYYNIFIKQIEDRELFYYFHIYLLHNFFNPLIETRGVIPHYAIIPFQNFILTHNEQNSRRFEYYHFFLYRLYVCGSLDSNLKLIYQKMQYFFKYYNRYYNYRLKFKHQVFAVNQNSQEVRKKMFLCFQQGDIQSKLFFANLLMKIQQQQKRYRVKINSFKNSITQTINNNNLRKQVQKYQQLLQPVFLEGLQMIYHQLPIKKHYLTHQVELLNQIFQMILVFNYFNGLKQKTTIDSYLHNIETMIRKGDCIECVFKTFLRLITIRGKKAMINKQFQKTCELYFQMGLFCMKYGMNIEVASHYSYYIIQIVSLYERIWQGYNPYLLNHYFIQVGDQYETYLQQLRQRSLVHIYCYFYDRWFKQQLFRLMQKLLRVLATTDSPTYCRNFYERIRMGLNNCTRKENIFKFHEPIINSMLKGNDNIYVGYYFGVLLLFAQKTDVSTSFLMTICVSLNRINQISRNIILSILYSRLLEIFQFKPRKGRYFKKKHFKHSLKVNKFRTILKCLKISRTSQDIRCNQIRKKLKKFYKNADNIK